MLKKDCNSRLEYNEAENKEWKKIIKARGVF